MGACCTGKETKSDIRNEELNWKIFKSQSHSEMRRISTPKIEFDVDNTLFGYNLSNLIQKFQKDKDQLNNTKFEKFSMERLWNVHKFYLDDFTNSDYILCDVRENLEKTENFLKKFKKINYSLDELKMLNENQFTRFKRFLNAKNLIFILKEDKMKIVEEFLNFLYEKGVMSVIAKILFLDNSMNIKDLSFNYKNFYEMQDNKNFKNLPYALFPLKIFPHLKSESFIFFDLYNFENNLNSHPVELLNNQDKKNKYTSLNDVIKFFECFNITNVLIVKGATTNHLSSNGDSNVNINTNRNVSKIYDGFANISHAKIKSENGASNPNTGGNTKINCKLIKLNLSSVSELKDKKDFLNFQFFSIRKDIISRGSFFMIIDKNLNPELISHLIFLAIWKISDMKPLGIKMYMLENLMFVKGLSEFCENSENLER
jgi:hypothetical protein